MRLACIVALGLSACGYTVTANGGAARAIAVGRFVEPGIDVDAAAMVNAAVRHALSASPSTRLVSEGEAEETLDIELVNAASAGTQLSDANLRAAQYKAVIWVRGRLVDKTGKVIWASPLITGEAPFLSTPGPIETLDGARRRALARAADVAAERLVASLTWR